MDKKKEKEMKMTANNQSNKNLYTKNLSVLEYYFKTNRVTVAQDMLNSTSKKNAKENVCIRESEENDKLKRKDQEEITFKFYNEELGVEMKKNLRIIREIRFLDEQVVKNWLEDFEEISNFRKWSIKQQLQALGLLIKDPILKSIFLMEDFESVKLEIKSKVMRRMDSNIIHSKLKQREFVYIRDFLSEIKKLVDHYASIEGISKIEYNKKLKESFLHGLGFYTKMLVSEEA